MEIGTKRESFPTGRHSTAFSRRRRRNLRGRRSCPINDQVGKEINEIEQVLDKWNIAHVLL